MSRAKGNSFAKRTHWSQQTPPSNKAREEATHGHHHHMVNTEIIQYIFFVAKDSSSVQAAKTRPGADCGPDHELLIAKFRLKMKKVGKTIRSLRYDPYQILMM